MMTRRLPAGLTHADYLAWLTSRTLAGTGES